MSEEKSSTGLVRVATDEMRAIRPARRVHLDPWSVLPHREVEVVTAEEMRQEEQTRHKTDVPKDFFRSSPPIEPPIAPGIAVNCESLLGFLEAIEKILPEEEAFPILSSAKVFHLPEDEEPKLYLEAGSHAVWAMVAIAGVGERPRSGFTAALPVHRTKNILKELRDHYPNVVVGVDAAGVGIGPRLVPFGGRIDDFPERPVLKEWVARAAMPATYFREICARVLTARSDDFKESALQGALFDFEWHEIDGVSRPLCTVVATDGHRVHVLRLPQMQIEVKPTHIRALPPTCTVSAGFFHYMKEIIQHEWAALEFSGDQVVARGDDFLVVAKAPTEARSSLRELAGWRRFNIDHPGFWLASRQQLEQLVKASSMEGAAEVCSLRIDGRKSLLQVSSTRSNGERYAEAMPVRGFNAAPAVEVYATIQFVLDAIDASSGGLVRLAFDHDPKAQSTQPFVIRGEDEQFKAIIMPRK